MAVPAQAQSSSNIIVLEDANPSFQVSSLVDLRLEDLPGSSIAQVDKMGPKQFTTVPANQMLPLSTDHGAWLRLKLVRAPGSHAHWTLHLPLPYLDHAALYLRDNRGNWVPQVAGDTLAVDQWTHPALYPDFSLELNDQGVTEALLHVRNFKPVSLPLHLVQESTRARQREIESLGLGALLGMMGMLVGVCAIHYSQSGQRDDAWYTLYTVLMAIVIASSTGLTSLWLWPTSPVWANFAHMALPVVCIGTTTLFVRHVTSLDVAYPRLAHALYAVGLVSLPLALLAAAIDRRVADHTNGLYLATGSVLIVLATVLTWRRGYAVSKWLFMAYGPQGLTVLVLAAQTWGWLPAWWQARYALILAVAMTVPLLQQALYARARERRDVQDRAKALPTQDALTGLLTPALFQHQVDLAISRAKHDGEPSAIVLVDVVNAKYLREQYGDAAAEQCLLRAAVKLHRVLRDVDPAGRIDSARFGLVLDGVSDRQALTERMVRLIASGLIPLPGLQPEVTLQFHVACVLLHEVIPNRQTVLEELGNVMHGISPRTRRPIRFLEAPDTVPADMDSVQSNA
ncbi:MAG: 7TM diverse intracellular signaling domain-containing protein [Rhodoferax sp.]|nr:7TM diverse intracellular signaling domain-containing protein [Rhodoferax sp.]